jgi:predicted O-methyltransferase YrrM
VSVLYHPAVKDRVGAIVREEQERYLDSLLRPRDPLRRRIEAAAAHEGIPIADPALGALLEVLARAIGAARILELGTAIGYGTLSLALGAPGARVVTLDRDPGRLDRARELLTEAGVAERVELLEGEITDLLPRIQGPFDLVFIDADKAGYRRYLDGVLPLVRVGGLIVVDNLLWKGHIAEPPDVDEADEDARAVEAFNGYFSIHPQLQSLILPLGDGVGIATKLRPLVTEMGGPF